MVPLIIWTTPENGSKDLPLTSVLKIGFADALLATTVNAANIKLWNVTQNRAANVVISWSADDKELTVTPQDGLNGDTLLGLCTYKLSIANVASPSGERMQGTATLEFDSMPASLPEQEGESEYPRAEVVRWYPKSESAGMTPTNVRVLFDSPIIAESVTSSTFFVTWDWIEDPADVGFLEFEKIPGNSVVTSKTIVWTPEAELPSNERLTIVVSGVTDSAHGLPCETQLSSFHTAYDPCDIDIRDLKSNFSAYQSVAGDVTENDIYSIIKSNSEYARYLATTAGNAIDFDNPPDYVIRYVTDKTRYDLVLNKYVSISSESTRKQLADLQVEYGQNFANLLPLLDRLKAAYEKWEALIKGKATSKAGISMVQVGVDVDEDPDFMNRRFTSFDGSKSWEAT